MALQCAQEAIIDEQYKPASTIETFNVSANVANNNSPLGFNPWQAIANTKGREEPDTGEVAFCNIASVKLSPQQFQCRMVARK